MNSKETSNFQSIETYKNSIMKRYEKALEKTSGANCHDAVYFLLGVEPEEYGHDDYCRIFLDIFEPTNNIEDTFLVAFGIYKQFKNDPYFKARHIAALHPNDKTQVIHRDVEGYYLTRRSHHNLLTAYLDYFEQITSGPNPIMIERLEDVQKRWKDFPMQMFTFKQEYFEKLLCGSNKVPYIIHK